MADLDRRLRDLDVAGRDVDLGDLALRAGLAGVGDDLVLELGGSRRRGRPRGTWRGRRLRSASWSDRARRPRSAAISVTRPIRKMPSSPSMTSVMPFASALKSGRLTRPSSSRRSRPIQPRSPPWSRVATSVETLLATSSQDLPPLMSRSASSAFFFASAFWASVGSGAPSSTAGSTAMHPDVARFRGRRLLDALGVDVCVGDRDALVGRELRLDAVVDDPLERKVARICWALVDQSCRACSAWASVRRPLATWLAIRRSCSWSRHCLDGRPLAELVLGDRLAGDAADRREVVVVPGVADGDDEDEDRRDDDERRSRCSGKGPPVCGSRRVSWAA